MNDARGYKLLAENARISFNYFIYRELNINIIFDI